MPKKPTDEEEAELFRKNVGKVNRLKQDKHRVTPPKKKILILHPEESPPTLWGTTVDLNNWITGEDSLHFLKGGLQHKVIKRLKRGRMQIEATIDLHHQTINEATENVSQFIDDCVIKGKQWILIIHGKGNFSSNGKPILKIFLNKWLRDQPDVLAFHSAPASRGGTGALIVLLKKRGYREE